MRLMSRLSTFDPQNRFSTWVLGYALNVCREMRRAHQKESQHIETELPEAQEELSPADLLFSKETHQDVRKAVDELPNRQQQAILLRYFESLTLADIADVMDLKVGTVKATLNHALRNLKKRLD